MARAVAPAHSELRDRMVAIAVATLAASTGAFMVKRSREAERPAARAAEPGQAA